MITKVINESSSSQETGGVAKPPPSPGPQRKGDKKREGRAKKDKKKTKGGSESPSIPRKLLSRARSSSRESLCSLDGDEVLVRHYSTEDLSQLP